MLNSNIDDVGTYALVTYNNQSEAIWFQKVKTDKEYWFLESPCQLVILGEIGNNIDKFLDDYLNELKTEMLDIVAEQYLSDSIIPMIRNGVLYEIMNYQGYPYLPERVEGIKLISESECLDYLLSQYKG